MAKIVQLKEWQNGSGDYWYCGATDFLGVQGVSLWTIPARTMGLSIPDFIHYLLDTYKTVKVYGREDGSFVGWKWKSQSEMRDFKNKMNRLLRDKKVML